MFVYWLQTDKRLSIQEALARWWLIGKESQVGGMAAGSCLIAFQWLGVGCSDSGQTAPLAIKEVPNKRWGINSCGLTFMRSYSWGLSHNYEREAVFLTLVSLKKKGEQKFSKCLLAAAADMDQLLLLHCKVTLCFHLPHLPHLPPWGPHAHSEPLEVTHSFRWHFHL